MQKMVKKKLAKVLSFAINKYLLKKKPNAKKHISIRVGKFFSSHQKQRSGSIIAEKLLPPKSHVAQKYTYYY